MRSARFFFMRAKRRSSFNLQKSAGNVPAVMTSARFTR
jgi:hypothetical protein